MKLNELISSLAFTVSKEELRDFEVSSIAFDSRKVMPNSIFVAIKGTQSDGHDFIAKAIENGAKAIVVESWNVEKPDGVNFYKVNDSSEALGKLASAFYGHPSKKMKVVAVTGTNGKTSVATMLYELHKVMGYNTGLFSTVENRIKDEVVTATHTTPDPIAIHSLMAEMVKKGCSHCFMEASSHAIHQNRLAGVDLDGAIFTNISHDHLDYHGTFDNYIEAKKKLFDHLKPTAFALSNKDDKRGNVMLQNTKGKKYFYSLKSDAEFKGLMLSNTLQGLELEINGIKAWFRLIGLFNAYNLIAVFAAATLLGENELETLSALSSVQAPKGRFQILKSSSGSFAIVDYAHTPDALENVLKTLEEFKEGGKKSVITVVGCGGDRDKSKRPLMAAIACRLSDKLILTSDNPRSENPDEILEQMMAGVPVSQKQKVLKITDRKEAIKTACVFAKPNDIILVAGKGHENYQEIKGVKHPFDDYEILKEIFNPKEN
ncbi:MAG: UDP-N-acetylmuramoyl-L-alanyl-D-glutamate--2,6-diaminopimelate ligase [Cytophagales bacterium]